MRQKRTLVRRLEADIRMGSGSRSGSDPSTLWPVADCLLDGDHALAQQRALLRFVDTSVTLPSCGRILIIDELPLKPGPPIPLQRRR